MIEGLKPYPAYTETGLPWLGQIPATWKLRRAKYLFREVDERSKTGSEELLSVSHKTGVTPRSQKNVTMFMAESNVGHKVCRPDDLVINTLWAWMAALGVSSHHGLVSPAYGVYRPIDPSGFRPRFADQLLRTPFYAAEYRRCSTGVNSSRLRLYPEAFFRIPIMLPPKEEQEAIVRFLAHANQKIDGFIRAKRKLIVLLNEQKQAIIHQAVTRGLDPSVPLKPSGIPWLGDIPQHWETLALKRVLRRLIDCEHKTAPVSEASDLLVVRTTGIRHGTLKIHGTYGTTPQAFAHWTRRGVPEPGDVLFTREAPVGEACVMPAGLNLCMGQRTVLMKLRKNRLVAEFLVHTIYAGPPRVAITLASQGSTVGHFNMSDIGDLTILLPPPEEQLEIVSVVAEKVGPLDTAITRTEREIALMQEYRTRLTADLVTGKLDVREAASKLPEVADHSVSPMTDDADETEEVMEEEAA